MLVGLPSRGELDVKKLYKTLTVETPGSNENITFFFTLEEIEISRVRSIIKAGTSVTWQLKFDSNRNATGTDVFTAQQTTTSATTVQIHTAFAATIIPAGSFIWFTTSSVVLTPSEISITLEAT